MARSRNTEMPNLFVIGAMKCGTSSLHHYLRLHPEVSMSFEKEPNFFVTSHHSEINLWIGDRDRYLGLFGSGAAIRGEASHRYTHFPYIGGVPEAIASEVSDPKLIYLVRDPVERMDAHVREVLSARIGGAKHLPPDISPVELIGDLEDPANQFVCPGLYWTQIRQYLEFFPPESLLVVDSDDLRSSRRPTMARIFGFLGVDADFWDEEMGRELNTAQDQRRRSAIYVRFSEVPALKAAIERMPPRARREVIGLARRRLSRPWTPPTTDGVLRDRLRALYRPEVAELRKFTGQDFAGWSI